MKSATISTGNTHLPILHAEEIEGAVKTVAGVDKDSVNVAFILQQSEAELRRRANLH